MEESFRDSFDYEFFKENRKSIDFETFAIILKAFMVNDQRSVCMDVDFLRNSTFDEITLTPYKLKVFLNFIQQITEYPPHKIMWKTATPIRDYYFRGARVKKTFGENKLSTLYRKIYTILKKDSTHFTEETKKKKSL